MMFLVKKVHYSSYSVSPSSVLFTRDKTSSVWSVAILLHSRMLPWLSNILVPSCILLSTRYVHDTLKCYYCFLEYISKLFKRIEPAVICEGTASFVRLVNLNFAASGSGVYCLNYCKVTKRFNTHAWSRKYLCVSFDVSGQFSVDYTKPRPSILIISEQKRPTNSVILGVRTSSWSVLSTSVMSYRHVASSTRMKDCILVRY